MRILLLVAGLGLIIPSDGASQLAGYFEGPVSLLPDSLAEFRGDFAIRVSRAWADDAQRELIQTAERLLPPASLIEDAATDFVQQHTGVARQNWAVRFEQARSIPGARWWWLQESRVRVPFALTGEAALHLIERLRELSRGPPPPPRLGGEPMHRGTMEYTARVAESGADGAVVELAASWSYLCGGLCGLSFTATRRVTFDQNGTPIRVEGDGPAETLVR